ncbi:MAG: MlaD family protein [Megasphaera sp.]|jgi:phospholipid/cholesterol/gamma-HCH transport system substrate-binding protein|nr:MlaD family protein [Megasphaera sp.]MCH4187111.1 MlaD family protein [Megasphaera sp.]MCH4216953.1 MlaD family protein [Megasphaera sp.]
MKWSAEAKVGLVTIIGVLMFTYVVISLAHAEIFGKPGFEVHTVFQDANGLQQGNSVRYVGVNVGKVEGVTPSKDGVDVKMKLNKGTEIPKDSKVAITTDGLLGEKIVAITPGKDKGHLLADGDILGGVQTKTMDDMMTSANTLMADANDMLKSLNAVIGDPSTQQALRGSFKNIESMTANMSGVTGKANSMMDANAANIQEMTAHMAAVTAQMDASMQSMDGDGSASANVRQTAANMKEITDNFVTVSEQMKTVTTDPQTQSNIQTTLDNAAKITTRVNKILGGDSGIRVQGDAGLLYNDTKNKSSGQVNFKVYRNNDFALIGAENIGNGTNLNLQLGRHSKWFDSRFGLINGDLGAGLDLFTDKPFQLTLEGYDPDDWRYRIKARMRLMPDVYLFGQFTRPMKRGDGGNYYGIDYAF